MKLRRVIVVFGMLFFVAGSLWLFWQEELRASRSTEKPPSLREPQLGEQISIPLPPPTPAALSGGPDSPRPEQGTLLHFYQPSCPCSRFALDHIRQLSRRFGHLASMAVVIPEAASLPLARQQLERAGLSLPILIDRSGSYSQVAGVYATPQAVLLDPQQRLLYKGNYNRSRYCMDPETQYVRLALEAFEQGRPVLLPPSTAGKAFGCAWPAPAERIRSGA